MSHLCVLSNKNSRERVRSWFLKFRKKSDPKIRLDPRLRRGDIWLSGFTLVELLIVIAILAVLAAAVVIVLNPAELLAQARDGQRSSDMRSIGDATSLFVIDNPSASLGTTNKVYISLPDANANCSGVAGLPTLPTGFTYNCVTAANLKKIDGTGWVPIDFSTIKGGSPIPFLPTDPSNSTTFYYSYIPGASTQYAISANIESVRQRQSGQSGLFSTRFTQGSAPQLAAIPQGGDWVRVSGNSTYGTSDFWVMKYEAKCLDSGGAPLLAPDTGYNTYSNSGLPCVNASSRYISSVKNGYPIANISHDTAKTYCASIGAHLMTNEEYMTIARSAENIGTNWSGGSQGSGYLYSGHNDNVPALALQASSDSDGYFGTQNTSGNQKRTFTISSGETIWDIAGNVWEHVQRTSADTQTTITTPTCSSGTGWQWCQYGSTTSPYVSAWTADVAQNYVGPSNTSWNSSQGMGQVYTNSGAAGGTVFLRGGYWSSGSTAGAFALFLSWSGGSTGSSVGFRCAR